MPARSITDGVDPSNGRKGFGNLVRNPISIASAAILIAGVAALGAWSLGVFGNSGDDNVYRAVEVTDEDGESGSTEMVPDNGTFVSEDGDEIDTLASQPLPEEARAEVDESLSQLDATSESVQSDAAEYLGTALASTGRSYISITPAVLSCDGEEYFEGYAVSGEFDESLMTQEACERQATLDGARELADEFANADPALAGTYEVFEIGIDDADEIYASAATVESDPTVHEDSQTDNSGLSEDEMQTFGGDIEGSTAKPDKIAPDDVDVTEPDPETGK